MTDTYQLIYWPGIPGRGEYIRLALTAGGANYTDTCNDTNSAKEVFHRISGDYTGDPGNAPPFAPPILVHGSLELSQTPNILYYLGPKLGLAPSDEVGRSVVNQLQLTLSDLANEVHDVHHPISVSSYYEEQKQEALRRSDDLKGKRIPKFLGYFEKCIVDEQSWLADRALLARRTAASPASSTWNAADQVHGTMTYADLSLFQNIEGLEFAFPKFMAKEKGKYPKVMSIHNRVKRLPQLSEYLKTRIKFGDGLFRHYPELDDA